MVLQVESCSAADASGRAGLLPGPQKRRMSVISVPRERNAGWTFRKQSSWLGGDPGSGNPAWEVSCCL